MYLSPDGDETVFAWALPAAELSATAAAMPVDLPRLAQEFVSQWNAGLVLSRGGPANIFQGPDPVQIPNADAGVALTAVVADPLGDPFVAGFRIAIQGGAVYIFVLLAPEDFYTSDPNFGRILDSFQLIRPPAFALSPEEAVIALLPYELSAQDAPPGYIAPRVLPEGTAVDTAITLAGRSLSPAVTFKFYQDAGFVVGLHQPLLPTATPTSPARFSVSLLTDAPAARKYATSVPVNLPPSGERLSLEPVDLGLTIGDTRAAAHLTRTPPDQPAQGFYIVRWQRGRVVFELTTAAQPSGQERQEDAESLASTLDSIEAARPPLSLGSPTVMPPATEDQRLQMVLRLAPFPAGAAPDGYRLADFYFNHPAERVGNGADPVAELHKVDEQWREEVGGGQIFTNEQDSRAGLFAGATAYADPYGAMSAFADYEPVPTFTSSNSVDPPVRLGDATRAYRAAGTLEDGSAVEGIFLIWTHGTLVLIIEMFGPAGSGSMDRVVALAQQVEARFQATPLPTSGVGGFWALQK